MVGVFYIRRAEKEHFFFELSFPCKWWEFFTKEEWKKAGKRNKALPLVQTNSPWALQDIAL